jgi:hypothetical protein
VFVRPFFGNSVRPGQTAGYAIWVWSTVTEAKRVTVTAAIGSVAHVGAPRFTVCPTLRRNVCPVGTLLTGQSEELVAGALVERTASSGEPITLTVTARARGAHSFRSAATIHVVAAGRPGPAPEPLPTSTIPPGSVPPLPSGWFTSPNGDPSGLFPTVAPTGSGLPSATAGSAPGVLNHSSARDVSATVPLNTRLLGGQIAGLVVLAIAVAIAIARLSLRGPRPHDGGDAAK